MVRAKISFVMGKATIRQFKNKVEISLHNIFMFHVSFNPCCLFFDKNCT